MHKRVKYLEKWMMKEDKNFNSMYPEKKVRYESVKNEKMWNRTTLLGHLYEAN